MNTIMLAFMNFEWLLKLIYQILKFSGFQFFTIDFSSFSKITMRKSLTNYASFIISFGFSLYACTYDGYLPAVKITHSQIMEVGVNINGRLSIYVSCALKVANMLHRSSFFDIVSKLQWNHLKVICDKFKLNLRSNNFILSFKTTVYNRCQNIKSFTQLQSSTSK